MSTSYALVPILLVASTIGCQSSAERGRIEMQSVYRSAKALDEQLKAGADMNEVHKLQGNLATELAIVHDRMTSDPSMDKLPRQHYAAYQAVLQSYSLVTDTVEYHRAEEQCLARPKEVQDRDFQQMSLEEKEAYVIAQGKLLQRLPECIERYKDLGKSLQQRADVFGMNCPSYSDSGCLVKFAEGKLSSAEDVLLGSRAKR